MSSNSQGALIAKLIFIFFWIFFLLAIHIIGKKNDKISQLKEKMIKNWKQSLVIALIYYISAVIGNSKILSLTNILVSASLFCQCLIGLTIAKGINEFEPLPLTKAIIEHKKIWKKIISLLVFGIIITFLNLLIGAFSQNITSQIFNENVSSSQAVNMLPENKWMLFFALLAGAGIAEETIYRLIFLSFFLKLTNKKWLSVVLSSLIFGIYHLTPINSMHSIYWQFPITQLVSTTLGGIIFGYFYVKRGYETAVIGHTLADWLPIMIFMR